jgi:hypothetical protein
MGLKYSLFLIKMDTKELLDKLLAAGLIDQTEQMKKDAEWETEQFEEFQKIARDKTTDIQQKMDKIDKLNEIVPDDEALREYRVKESDPALTHIFIWWKELPGTQFVFGGFTTYMIERRLFEGYVSVLFAKAKVIECMFVDYAHTANEGTALLVKNMAGKFEVENFEITKSETEHFERYAKRVEKKTSYPITAMHAEMSDASKIAWDHCVAYKMEKKVKVTGGEK